MGAFVIVLPIVYRGLPDRMGLVFQIVFGIVIYGSLLRMVNQGALNEFRSVLLSR